MYGSETEFLESRSRAITDIESTISELATIFQQLARMVSEQGDLTRRIDANMTDCLMNVEAGQNELLKYFRSISSNRWLMVKIVAILFVFFLLFVWIV
jgi:t-SNARE complex subunit (syntaxin)